MKKVNILSFLTPLVFLFSACTPSKYILDHQSFERQKNMKKYRSANIVADVGSSLFSIFLALVFDLETENEPTQKQFKKITLDNPTGDTVFVNMLTDVNWDDSVYCDFMDIRIPPQKKIRLLVPVNANYNLYFSPTPEADDDELLQLNTSKKRKIVLQPGKKEELNKNLNQ